MSAVNLAELRARWRSIALDPKANRDYALPCSLDRCVAEAVKAGASTWLDLLPGGPRPAIFSSDGRQPFTHEELRAFLTSTDLTRFGISSTDVVCSSVENGPEAVCLFLSVPLKAISCETLLLC